MRPANPIIRKNVEIPVSLYNQVARIATTRQMSVTALILSALEMAVERERQQAELDAHMEVESSK